jgi:hypothetical protein
MEGVIALMIPIVAVGGFFAWMIALSPVGKAYAEKLRGGSKGAGAEVQGREEILEALDQVRHEVAELAERVDFTERLLAKQREGDRLAPPSSR